MPRLRTLKPGFFNNDLLAEVEPLGRLLFAGLWTIADKAGRLEDRPRRIKAEVLPYDDADVEDLLNQLAERNFIIRYTANDNTYIQIVNFEKHQTPHYKEAESTIPAPGLPQACTGQAQDKHRESTILAPLGSGEWELGSGNLELGSGCADALEAADAAHTPTDEAPEFVKILSEVPGWAEYGQPPEHCVQYLQRKGISLERAEETARQLKAKWGGKGWKWKDPWATFQDWVLKPPRAGPSPPNGAHHRNGNGANSTGGANGITSGNSAADFAEEQRKQRERQQSRARGGNGGPGKA